MPHTARISIVKHAPANFKALINLSASVKQSSLGERLVELVNLRISQINGCGFCIDMHWRDLIRQGADPRHLNTVAAWRESPFFSEREAAALRWAEIVNAQPHADASDAELIKSGIAVDPEALRAGWRDTVSSVLAQATLKIPASNWMQRGGRTGHHSEHLGHLLSELQSIQRTFPNATW